LFSAALCKSKDSNESSICNTGILQYIQRISSVPKMRSTARQERWT
jgi:hypothetical protein